jgi:hypothetical protein
MKVIVADLEDNGDYLDLNVYIQTGGKNDPEYQWRPYRDNQTGHFGFSDFRLAENTRKLFDDCNDPPRAVYAAILPYAREVAARLGVSTSRVAAAVQMKYDKSL